MKDILVIILFSMILNPLITNAQVTQEWVATYTGIGTGGNYAVKNAIDKFGNLIVAGRSDSTSEDYIILKYSNSGNLLWSKRYAGAANSTDKIRDMVLDDSGNIYVTGISYEGISLGGQNWLTIKYNANGELVWKQSLNWTGNRSDVPASIALDKNNNVYVTGYEYVAPAPLLKEDLVVAKYNIKGNLEWTRSHSSPTAYSAHGFSVVTDSSNYVYVSGYSYDSIITIKYSESGNTMWERTFFNIEANYVVPVYAKIDKQNNIIVNGWYTVATQDNFVTLKNDNDSNFNAENPNIRFVDQSSNAITGLMFAKLNSDPEEKRELIVTRSDGKIYRFLNDDGIISNSSIQTIHTANGTVAAVGKFTTDNNEDIAVISGNDVKIYKSAGNGSLDTTAAYTLSNVSANKVLNSQISSYIYPYSVINNTTADRDEIIIRTGTNIKIYLNDNSNGTSSITTLTI